MTWCSVLVVLLLSLIRPGSQENGNSGCPAEKEKPWSYNNNLPNGPNKWSEKYPLCKGKTQSPLDFTGANTVLYERNQRNLDRDPVYNSIITRGHTIRKSNLFHREFETDGYNQPITKYKLKNNGYTVVVTPTDNVTRSILIRSLKTNFTLKQFHYHWGAKKGEGSEHRIDGKARDMEVQLVHKDKDDQIAVLSILMEIVLGGNLITHYPITSRLKDLKYAGDKIEVHAVGRRKELDQIELKYFFPKDATTYYVYNGSLTRPPCTPNVTWVVLKSAYEIDKKMVKDFRQLSSTTKENDKTGKCILVNNFRPTQPANGRKAVKY